MIHLNIYNIAAVINKRDKLDVTDADRITIYLELIDSLQGIGQIVSLTFKNIY